MKMRSLILGVFVAVLIAPVGRCQSDSMIHVNQFRGTTVGDKVSAAMKMCPAAPIPCILVVDASMAAAANGTMPALCSTCQLVDYRSGWPGPSMGSVVAINPTAGVDMGAAINSAFATGSVVKVMAASGNATSLIIIPKGGTLEFSGDGTFTHVGIRFSDSISDYGGTGNLICPGRATLKLANGANVDAVSQTNFSSLTGTTNPYGFSGKISGCIIDGNKANNATGWGIRTYGRREIYSDVTVQNSAQGCYWLENHDAASFSTANDDDAQTLSHFKAVNCGGDGVYNAQGQGWTLSDGAVWGTGGWGLDVHGGALYVQGFNTYLNGSGGCLVGGASSGIIASNMVCSNAAGWGMLIDSGAGGSTITSSSFGCNGCIGIEVRSPAQSISGIIANSVTGIKFNGGGSGNYHLTTFGNSTVVNCTAFNGTPEIHIVSNDGTQTIFDAATCGSATVPPAAGMWTIATPALSVSSVPFGSIYAAGWHFTYPTLSGTFAVLNNSGQNTGAMYMGSYFEGGSNNAVPATSTGVQVAGQVACIKSLGPPVLIGTCSGTVSATTGACGTCN